MEGLGTRLPLGESCFLLIIHLMYAQMDKCCDTADDKLSVSSMDVKKFAIS